MLFFPFAEGCEGKRFLDSVNDGLVVGVKRERRVG
jgi:hypothetical protein